MASKELLLAKAQDAVKKGIITADNYQDAISATRDNPELSDYLNSVFPEPTQMPEAEQLPSQYKVEGTEVSQEVFEEISSQDNSIFIGDLNPNDASLPVESEEIDFSPTDRAVEEIDFSPTDRAVESEEPEEIDFSPTDRAVKDLTFEQKNKEALNAGVDLTLNTPEVEELKAFAASNEDNTLRLAHARFSPETIASWKTNPIGFKEAYRFLDPEDITPLGGLYKGYEAIGLAVIVDKMRKEEELTDSEVRKLHDFVDLELEKSIRGFSWGGGMAYHGTPVPAFIAEFMLSFGGGKVAQTAAVTAITKGVMVAAETAMLAKYAGYGARAVATSTAMVPMSTRNVGQEFLNNRLLITPKGQTFMVESKENPVITTLKAFAYTNAEVVSEMSGRKIGTYVINPIARRMATPFNTAISKLPPKFVNGIIEMYQKIKPGARVTDILSRGGWHGALNELGEERVADALRLYTDYGFGDTFTPEEILDRLVPDTDQFLVEAGIVSVLGGLTTAGAAVGNILENRGVTQAEINEVLEGLTEQELEDIIVNDTYVEVNPTREQLEEEEKIASMSEEQQAKAIRNKVTEALLEVDSANRSKSYNERVKSNIRDLKKRIKETRKNNLKFVDFVAMGGAIDVNQLIYHGADKSIFYNFDRVGRNVSNKKSPFGKKFKRVWSVNNPTQSLSNLTERYNEEMGLFDMTVAADQGGAITDSEMAEILTDWLYESNTTSFFHSYAQSEIDMLEDEVSNLESNLDNPAALEEYLDTVAMDANEYGDNLVPIVTESSIEGIEYAETIEEMEFAEIFREYDAMLEQQVAEAKDEMYSIEGRLYDEVLDQQDLIDNNKPEIDHTQSLFAGFYGNWINKYDSIERALKAAVKKGAPILAGTNPKLLISSYMGVVDKIKIALQNSTFRVDAKGKTIYTGLGLRPIMEGFDSLVLPFEGKEAARRKDLLQYMNAKRIQQDLQNYTIPGVRDAAPEVEAEIDSGLPDAPNLNEQYDEFVAAGENVRDSSEQEIADQKEGFSYGYTAAYGEEVEVNDLLGIDENVSSAFEMGYYYGREAGQVNNPKFGEYESSVVEKAPELAGPTLPQATVVQPDFAKDKKFVGPVQERRVTEEQAMQAEIDLLNLEMKYGDNLSSFETTAKELYEYQLRILHLLVDSGNMSQEQYDDIAKNNTAYIPFQRVMINNFLKESGFNREQIGTVLNVLTDSEIDKIIEEGVITQEQYDKVVTNDPGTIKLLETFKDGGFKGKGLFNNASSNQITQRLTGSDLAVKDGINSIISNTGRIIDISSRNRIARSIGNLSQWAPENIQKVKPVMVPFMVDGKQTMRPAPIQPEGTMLVYRDGKKEYYKVSKPILDAVNGMVAEQVSTLEMILISPVTLFRAAATITPQFVAANAIKDSFTAFAMTEARPTPIDTVKAVASIIDDGEMYREWMASGGSMGTYMDLTDTGLVKLQKDMLTKPKYWKRILKTGGLAIPADLSRKVEQSVRVGVYTAAKRKGMSDIEAAFESRQATVDFMRSGIKGKKVNRYVPFFNAAVQGSDKLIRTMYKSPKATSAIMFATITLPTIAITGYYLYGAPEDERQEYLNQPQWVRDSHWLYKQGDTWARIPKPFAPGYIFGTLPEKFMVWMYEGDKPQGKKLYDDVGKGLLTSFSPISSPESIVPPHIKLLLELEANYNFFQERALYPEYLEGLEPELRFTNSTSEVAKELGKKFNVSPAKVDAGLKGTFAGSSKYITNAGDMILNSYKASQGEDVIPEPLSIRNNPIVARFTTEDPTGIQSQSVSDFYDLAEEINIKNNSMKRYKGKELEDYLEKNAFMISQIPLFKYSGKQLSEIHKLKREMLNSMDYSALEKQELKEQYGKQAFDIASNALDVYFDGLDEY